MTRRVLALAAAALIAVGGCSADPDGEVTEQPTASNRPTETDPAAGEDEIVEPEPEPTPTANPRFGETFTYDDGLAVTVTDLRPFTPSSGAATGGEAQFVAVTVAITNGTPGNYDPIEFSTTAQSGNAEATQVYDTNVGPPQTPILPGREGAFTIAWGVTNPADLVMQVTPRYSTPGVIFTT